MQTKSQEIKASEADTEKALDALLLARLGLVLREPFFGQLAMRLKVVHDDNVQTCATDGSRLYFNSKFVLSLSKPELLFVVAHEVLHCANGHVWREGHRNHTLWNIAADFSINGILVACGFTKPELALLDEKYSGMSAEEIYSKLPVTMVNMGCGIGEVMPGGSGKEKSSSDFSEADWQQATILAAESAKAQGKLTGELEKIVLNITSPKIDWKAALQNIIQQVLAKDDFSWRRPNERYAPQGLYLPKLRSERVPPIQIFVDSSGSCWDKEILEAFASEVNGIANQTRPEMIYVDYIDTSIHEGDAYEPGDDIQIRPRGGGGTCFRAIPQFVRDSGREPAVVITLTDGYCDWPEDTLECPTVWGINTDVVAPFGTTLNISDN